MKRRDFNILEHFKNYKFYYFLKRCVFKIIIYIYKLLNFNFLKRHLFTFHLAHDMPKVYSKMRLNSDGHGSLVCKISGPKATTLPAW